MDLRGTQHEHTNTARLSLCALLPREPSCYWRVATLKRTYVHSKHLSLPRPHPASVHHIDWLGQRQACYRFGATHINQPRLATNLPPLWGKPRATTDS
ncbi:hypothetical protein E2C01_079419 [Portunus trituberculatus]|uniref:Uncharacterized protein n=1 Tax=Portunus trituberculatus TaxID=210409 RepID=A0A5B7IWV2_PORTR|nr:hypothetical protein [Portunus trituberculatus]